MTNGNVTLSRGLRRALRTTIRRYRVRYAALCNFRGDFVLTILPQLGRVISYCSKNRNVFSNVPIKRRRSLRSPFITRSIFYRFAILTNVFTIRLVMNNRRTPKLELFSDGLGTLRVRLTRKTLYRTEIIIVTINLLIICNGIFRTNAYPPTLSSISVDDDRFTNRRQVFQVVFVIASTRRVSRRISAQYRRRVRAVVLRLHARDASRLINYVQVRDYYRHNTKEGFHDVVDATIRFPLNDRHRPIQSINGVNKESARSKGIMDASHYSKGLNVASRQRSAASGRICLLFRNRNASCFISVVNARSS